MIFPFVPRFNRLSSYKRTSVKTGPATRFPQIVHPKLGDGLFFFPLKAVKLERLNIICFQPALFRFPAVEELADSHL